jgi:OsmC-like protein
MKKRRPSHQAQVRLAADGGDPAQRTERVVIRHHRAPRVAWSVDVATGGHMLHLALAQCVFNNVLRIAQDRGVTVSDVGVVTDGGFNADGTASTGIECFIELAGTTDRSDLTSLAEEAFNGSSVVAILRRGGPVELTSVRATPQPHPQPSAG